MSQVRLPRAVGDCIAASVRSPRSPRRLAHRASSASASAARSAFAVAAHSSPSVCVSYYGSGVPDMVGMLDQVDCPVLFHFGSQDSYIPNEKVDAVNAALAGRVEHGVQRGDRTARVRQPRGDMFYDEPAAKRVVQDHGLPRRAPPHRLSSTSQFPQIARWAESAAAKRPSQFLGGRATGVSRTGSATRRVACGGARPRCSHAAGIATRPRGVRASKPCWMRNGS